MNIKDIIRTDAADRVVSEVFNKASEFLTEKKIKDFKLARNATSHEVFIPSQENVELLALDQKIDDWFESEVHKFLGIENYKAETKYNKSLITTVDDLQNALKTKLFNRFLLAALHGKNTLPYSSDNEEKTFNHSIDSYEYKLERRNYSMD